MPSLRPVLPLALAALALAGCGGPSAGGGCDTTGFTCADDATALECREGRWRALPCRGSRGCLEAGSRLVCDTSANAAGDACAASAEGRGLCSADGAGVLECREGVLVLARRCSDCREELGQVVCRP